MSGTGTVVETLHASAKRRLRLVDAQTAGGLDPDESLERQVAGLVLEISGTRFDTDQAAELSTALCAMGFTSQQKRRLVEAIGAACQDSGDPGVNPPSRKQQVHTTLENYLTKPIVDGLGDRAASIDSKASLFAAYLHRWGITCPQEALSTAASALVWSYNEEEWRRAAPMETRFGDGCVLGTSAG